MGVKAGVSTVFQARRPIGTDYLEDGVWKGQIMLYNSAGSIFNVTNITSTFSQFASDVGFLIDALND